MDATLETTVRNVLSLVSCVLVFSLDLMVVLLVSSFVVNPVHIQRDPTNGIRDFNPLKSL